MRNSEFQLMTLIAIDGSIKVRDAESTLHTPPASVSPRRKADQEPFGVGDIVSFPAAAGPAMWFAKDTVLDAVRRDRFAGLHEAAVCGDSSGWAASPQEALSLLLFLEQFPRNAFWGPARMYTANQPVRAIARDAIANGHDAAVEPLLVLFFYLPFSYSTDLHDQEVSIFLRATIHRQSLNMPSRTATSSAA